MMVSREHYGLHHLMFVINWNHEGIGPHVLITWGEKDSSVFWLKFNYILYATFTLWNSLVSVLNTCQTLHFSFSSNCVSSISMHLSIFSDGHENRKTDDPVIYRIYATMWLLVKFRHLRKRHFYIECHIHIQWLSKQQTHVIPTGNVQCTFFKFIEENMWFGWKPC